MKLNNNEITLCCGGKKCPVLRRLSSKEYEIQDDYGNTISIKKDQLKFIAEALEKLNDKCSMK